MTRGTDRDSTTAGGGVPAARGGPPDGEMTDRVRSLDWSATPLGPTEQWPQRLRAAVELCLAAPLPMMVVWGPHLTQIYNDAFRRVLGDKHPAALGRSYSETFAEIWDEVEAPLLAAMFDRGTGFHQEDRAVCFRRNGAMEEMFFTSSWTPISDETGTVRGGLHVVRETTSRVLAARRIEVLRDVAAQAGQPRTVREACARVASALDEHRDDLPFTALYLCRDDGLRLAAATGLDLPSPAAPPAVALPAEQGGSSWPFEQVLRSDRPAPVDDVPERFGPLSGGPWPEPVSEAMVLPLPEPGAHHPIGLLVAGVSPRRRLDHDYRGFLDLLAAQLATVIANARHLEQESATALTLQRSLLPGGSPTPVGIEVATRYLPGVEGTEVGGDWYDVIDLGAGRIGLVIGDVMGRGVHAAATMGQLRMAVRAYAHLDLPPAEVLTLLDGLVEEIGAGQPTPQLVTCIYAVYDITERRLTLANAGHLPPLLAGPDAAAVRLDHAAGTPLGVSAGGFTEQRVTLPPGATLALYTDGLVETRRTRIDTGIDAVAEALRGERGLEELCDELLARQQQSPGPPDDTALLLVRVASEDADASTAKFPLPVDLTAPARARVLVRRLLTEWGLSATVQETVTLLAAELTTNAVRHGRAPVALHLRRTGGLLVVEVSDASPALPQRRFATVDDEGGRGLQLVAALSQRWGARATTTGKRVWAQLPIDQ